MRSISSTLALAAAALLHAQTPVFQWADGANNIETPGIFAHANSISVASDGTAYVVGTTYGPRTILGDTMVGSGYLARFDQQGGLLWARSPGGSDVAVSGTNAVYVSGSFTGTLAFGATVLTATGADSYVAKYDAAGTLLWVHQIGGPGLNSAYTIGVDGLGMVHVAGHFQGSATFGGTTLVATHDSTGYLATIDPTGVDQWAALCGGLDASPDYISPFMSIDCDAMGNTFVSGVFDNTGSFGSTALTATDYDDIFLARFDMNGACTWVRKMGSFSGNEVHGVGVTPLGNVFVFGSYWGEPATFCGPALPNSNFGNLEMFLAMYDGGGTCQWAQRVGPNYFNDFPGNLEIDASGNAWITGHCSYIPAQFGSISYTGDGQFVARYDEAGNATLVESLTTATYASIGLGTSGDLYLIGDISGSAVFDELAGTNVFARLSGGEMGYIAHYDASHAFQWVQQIGPHGAAYDACADVALDASGNVYTTGYYSGSAIFCTDTLHSWLAGSSIFISKRDADGTCLWIRSIGTRGALSGSALNIGHAIIIDADGDLYVAGSFADSVRFGNFPLTSAGGTDLFLAKYDANGNCLWAVRGGGPGTDEARSVGLDAAGNVTIAGSYSATATIGSATFTSLGYNDGLLARYSGAGIFQWARTMGGTGGDQINDVVVDASGNSYITGRFTVSAAFGPIPLTSSGDADLFVAKYDQNGDPIWVKGSTGPGTKEAYSIAQSTNGKIYVTGDFSGTADFCTTDLTSSSLQFNAFLACYDAGGDELWAHDFQSTGESHGYGLAARPAGNIMLTGSVYGDITFGGTTLTSGSFSDVTLATFEPDGTALWAKRMGGTGTWDLSTGTSVAASSDAVYLAGSYGSFLHTATEQGGSIDLEPGDPLATLQGPNALDAFLVKFGSNETTNNPADPLGCDGTVQVEEASRPSADLLIAPNPVEHIFTVASRTPFDPGTRVVVHDALGREMRAPYSVEQGKIEVDATALTSGAYTITLSTITGKATRHFVKHRSLP